jgi:hypothetical protein
MLISEHALKDSPESRKVLEEVVEEAAILMLLKVRPDVLEELIPLQQQLPDKAPKYYG